MMNMSEKQIESMNAFRSFVGSDSFTRADYSDFKVVDYILKNIRI